MENMLAKKKSKVKRTERIKNESRNSICYARLLCFFFFFVFWFAFVSTMMEPSMSMQVQKREGGIYNQSVGFQILPQPKMKRRQPMHTLRCRNKSASTENEIDCEKGWGGLVRLMSHKSYR
jgi:hypothetical protein